MKARLEASRPLKTPRFFQLIETLVANPLLDIFVKIDRLDAECLTHAIKEIMDDIIANFRRN